MADFRAAGDQFGCRAFSSATTPDTCGVAMDVPEPITYASFMAPNMLAPGAAMSGCSGGNNNGIIILQELCTVFILSSSKYHRTTVPLGSTITKL